MMVYFYISGTKKNPLFLGPVLLHFDNHDSTFSAFFVHVAKKLNCIIEGIELAIPGKLIVGSDQERSLVKAILTAFPDAALVFCTLHLKQNLDRHLRLRNVSIKRRREIRHAIFGGNEVTGLTSCEREEEFIEKQLVFKANYAEFFDERYMNEYLKRILDNVLNPHWLTDAINLDFSNNDNECYNNILKRKANRRVLILPEICRLIEHVYKAQVNNAICAFQGFGQFILADHAKNKYRREEAIWKAKSDVEKEKIKNEFFKGKSMRPKEVVSESGLRMPNVDRVKKKVGQKKRPTTERSSNIGRKKAQTAPKVKKIIPKKAKKEEINEDLIYDDHEHDDVQVEVQNSNENEEDIFGSQQSERERDEFQELQEQQNQHDDVQVEVQNSNENEEDIFGSQQSERERVFQELQEQQNQHEDEVEEHQDQLAWMDVEELHDAEEVQGHIPRSSDKRNESPPEEVKRPKRKMTLDEAMESILPGSSKPPSKKKRKTATREINTPPRFKRTPTPKNKKRRKYNDPAFNVGTNDE